MSKGLIIAFVGANGSGKSTVAREIADWIGQQRECRFFYMGTGKGKTTVFSDAMKKAGKVERARREKTGREDRRGREKDTADCTRNTAVTSPARKIRSFIKLLMIYDIERKNYTKIRKMDRYRQNGIICVTDRFPQIEKEGRNDGPKMCLYEKIFGQTWFIKRLKAAEERHLSIVRKIKPDIVFRLNVSAETTMVRRGGHGSIEEYAGKLAELNTITFQNAKIIDINAEQPYEAELDEIKQILREYI